MEKIKKLKDTFNKLKLSHHSFNRIYRYLEWCFSEVDFIDKNVLDIGGGNGIYSYFSKFKGAKTVINLEPFESGSTYFENNLKTDLQIETINKTLQEFSTIEKFDIIILHDSFNHLDEEAYTKIHNDKESYLKYKGLVNQIVELARKDTYIIITDCAKRNFWGDLGLKNPFAPSIDWELHQSPKLIESLFSDIEIQSKLRWSPFKRFSGVGYFISNLGSVPSYFLQSHFNLKIKINK